MRCSNIGGVWSVKVMYWDNCDYVSHPRQKKIVFFFGVGMVLVLLFITAATLLGGRPMVDTPLLSCARMVGTHGSTGVRLVGDPSASSVFVSALNLRS